MGYMWDIIYLRCEKENPRLSTMVTWRLHSCQCLTLYFKFSVKKYFALGINSEWVKKLRGYGHITDDVILMVIVSLFEIVKQGLQLILSDNALLTLCTASLCVCAPPDSHK